MSGSSSNIVGGLKNACTCAVQIMEDLSRVAMRDGLPLEATITEGLSHPNVVNTLAHVVVPPATRGPLHDSAHSNKSSSRTSRSGSTGGVPSGSSGAEACTASTGSSTSSGVAAGSSLSGAPVGGKGSRAKAPAQKKAGAEGTAWLLLEFCDKGCLQVGGPNLSRLTSSRHALRKSTYRQWVPGRTGRSSYGCPSMALALA